MVPPDEGVYRFRYKEDEDTALPILPSVSCGITVTEADIAIILQEGTAVNDNTDPDPDNTMQSDDVFPTLLSLIFWFHGVDP